MTSHPWQAPVLACMAAHRTVRSFQPAPVPDEAIAQAVRAAQQAATSSWIQAYRLVQVTRPEERDRLARLAGNQAQIRAAGAFFVVCADHYRHRLVLEDAETPYEHNFEAFLTAALDGTLFAQNLVLAFESMGYGTCYIGAMRNDVAGVAEVLEFPEGVYPLFGLCVGVPAEDPGLRPRLPLEAIWTKDRVPSPESERQRIAAGDAVAQQYYAQRGHPKRSWTGGIVRRFNHLERTPLFEAYRSRGANLE